jgi:hypothetical protein
VIKEIVQEAGAQVGICAMESMDKFGGNLDGGKVCGSMATTHVAARAGTARARLTSQAGSPEQAAQHRHWLREVGGEGGVEVQETCGRQFLMEHEK